MERVDVYNKLREKTGVQKDRNKISDGEYRISTHIWIIDSNNNILVQKRSEREDIFPGMWAQTGGGVKEGKTSKEIVIDECMEELGLDVTEEELKYIASYTRTRDIVDVWMVNKDVDVKKLILDTEEVIKVKLVNFTEFDQMIENGEVVPSINPSYFLFKNYIDMYRKDNF